MNLTIESLKESNEFLKILSENLNSAIFIVDNQAKVQHFNHTTLDVFFQSPENMLHQYCGNAIGCIHPWEENTDCGKTSYCHQCHLRKGIINAVTKKEAVVKEVLEREFVFEGKKVKKYFHFSVKHALLNGKKMALIIIDDLTELEEKKRFAEEKNLAMQQELLLASQIQHNLMPHDVPSFLGLQIATLYHPMQELGGDFYDFIDLPHFSQRGIFISDVSGHGVSAALITSMVKTLVDNAGENKTSPSLLFSYLNKKLIDKTSENFLTAFYGVYNEKDKTLTYAGAGHPFPFLIRKGEIISLESRAMVLGVFDLIDFEEKTLALQKRDRILFYTDGLTEAYNSQNQPFSSKLKNLLLDLDKKPLDDFLNTLFLHWIQHQKGRKVEDDLCMVVFDVLD